MADTTYLSEVEDRFRYARDSEGCLFSLSPKDWVLADSWRSAGIPLQAVLTGIDRTVERRRRANLHGRVNSLAYCEQEVLAAAREMRRALPPQARAEEPEPKLDLEAFAIARAEELEAAARAASPMAKAAFSRAAKMLRALSLRAATGKAMDLAAVEDRLAKLERDVGAAAASSLDFGSRSRIGRDFEREMKPYRRQMGSAHFSDLKRRFTRRKALEALGISPLSLSAAEKG